MTKGYCEVANRSGNDASDGSRRGFPADFSAKSRAFFWSKFDDTMGYVTKAEAAIPSKYWIEIPASDIPDFDEMFQKSRIELRDTHKAYHPRCWV